MIFTQPIFALFFALTAGVHWSLSNARARKLWLLAASYVFYAYWDYRFVGLILLCTVFDYGVGILLGRTEAPRARRALITASLCMNLGLLGFFKYYGFFAQSLIEALDALGVQANSHVLHVVLPAGISFFTFQTMSYTIDVYRRKLEPQRDFLDFALFVAFFPQLVAGPIVRATQFLPQLKAPRILLDTDVRRGLLLFAAGYFKKACLADNIAAAIDPVFAQPSAFGAHDRLLSALLYSVQIYCDFSGYSDMAIGAAALLGYQLPKNFAAPYFSENVREFWQRWHITLSSWLRDYLYIPLGGSRRGTLVSMRNLMLTMLLGGLWHGANWTFVLWGFLHGLALAVHRAWDGRTEARRGEAARPAWQRAINMVATFGWVAGCFTIFRCANLDTVLAFIQPLHGAKHTGVPPSLDWWLVLPVLGAMHFWVHKHARELASRAQRTPEFSFYAGLGALSALLLYLTPLTAKPFIYFQF